MKESMWWGKAVSLKVKCPKCGSKNLLNYKGASSVVVTFPPIYYTRLACVDCDTEFHVKNRDRITPLAIIIGQQRFGYYRDGYGIKAQVDKESDK